MGKFKIALLAGIIILGFITRLYRFDNPIADWHSWRQADTSAVSRNFVASGFDILHPRFDDLSNVPTSGKYDNPNGYRFVEFPIYNVFQAGLYKIFDYFTLEEWGRLVTIFASLSTILLIFLILKKHQSEKAGLIGAFLFAVLPFSIYFGRTILPDPSTSTAILAGIYFFDLWIDENSKLKTQNAKLQFKSKNYLFFSLSILFTAVAVLLKPFALFFTLPMIYLAFNKFGKRAFINPYLWVFAVLSLAPFIGWRVWMSQFPEGIPSSNWLFNEGNVRFKGAFFNWVFAERIGKLILGYWGSSLLILGLISKTKTNYLFFYSFLASSILYLIIIARGNVQHDYYQILILPTICILGGLGGEFLLNTGKNLSNKFIAPVILIIILGFTFMFSWYHVRDYFNINNPSIIVGGAAVDRLTPKNAKIIANYNGDTSFLYQTKRKGWASYEKDLPVMINELGADYLVIANPTPSDSNFEKDYQIIESTSQYVIFDLHKSP